MAFSRVHGVRNLRNLLRVCLLLALAAVFNASCAEVAGTGEAVPIPRIFIECGTNTCKQDVFARTVVILTTSSCLTDFGYTISGSTESLRCDRTTGCRGEITSWVDANGNSTTTIPSGTYSVCGLIDPNRTYPPAQAGDSRGTLENVAIGTTTSNQFLINWSDL